MTNFQSTLMSAACAKVMYKVDLEDNRMVLVYKPWTVPDQLWFIMCKGVSHHNDEWEILEAGPFVEVSGKLDIPFTGKEGYRY